MSDNKRLYGPPDAELVYDDPATVWETEIEPDIIGPGRMVIYAWTVHDPIDHLPIAEYVIEHIYEWACDSGEVAEDWGDSFPLDDPVVRSAAETLLGAIANRIGYRMAKDIVAEHVIEWTGEEGENPLFDGEPMYRPARKE